MWDLAIIVHLHHALQAVFSPDRDVVEATPFAPYSEVFGIQRFRESELIHGRWAMLATLGAVVAEASTGVSWSVLINHSLSLSLSQK